MEDARYSGLGQSFKEIGEDLRESMPHVKIDEKKPVEVKQPEQIVPVYEGSMSKFKRWMLVILTSIVGGFAVLLLLTSIISRYFK